NRCTSLSIFSPLLVSCCSLSFFPRSSAHRDLPSLPTRRSSDLQTQQGIPRGKPCRLPSQPIEHACSATLQRLSVERELPIASSVVGVARLRAALASSLPGAFSSQALCPTRARRIAIGGRSL